MAIIKNKVTEEQVFKDKELIKNKSNVNQEKEQRLQQSFVKTIQEIQAEDPLESLNQKEKIQWSTSWARLPKTKMSTKPIVPQNLSTIPNNRDMSTEQIFQDINKQMMKTTYTLKLSQLLKITPNLKEYMWQKLKPVKPNKIIKMISKPNVAIVVQTHSKVDIVVINVDNQMAITQVQVGKITIEDVMLDGGANVNIIIENLKTKLSLPKPRLIPYHLKMAYYNMTKPLGIIRNLKIHIHGIPYVVTFTVLQNSVVDSNYSILLGRPWLKDAKVTHD